MADHRLLLFWRPGRRQLLRGHHDASVREEPGSPDGPSRLSGRFPAGLPLRAPAHRGPRTAGALLAHAGPVRDLPADDQDVLSDVERRLGAPALQRVRVSLLRRRPRRAGPAGLADPSAAGPDRTPGSAAHGDRALLGLYLAGYTGVLLSVTSRPIWADTTLLGLTFLISAGSTSAALLILLGAWSGLSRDRLHRLERFDRSALILEVLTIAALVASLGRIAIVWLNGWGFLLAGMVLGGIALPLLLDWRRPAENRPVWIAPALVLLGGLVLRMVIVLSSDRL